MTHLQLINHTKFYYQNLNVLTKITNKHHDN